MLLRELFNVDKPVIGVAHLEPLPGSPRYAGRFDAVLNAAIEDCKRLVRGGVDGIIVENFGDAPFKVRVSEAETIAAIAIVVWEVARRFRVPVGVNILRNSGPEAVAVGEVAGAKFVRVNCLCEASAGPEGLMEPVAREVAEIKGKLRSEVKVFADVRVKHAAPITSRSLREVVREYVERCGADALIVTGPETGSPPRLRDVEEIIRYSDVPVLVGSGVNPRNVSGFLKVADGVIVGSYFKVGGSTRNRVSTVRVKRLMGVVRRFRGG